MSRDSVDVAIASFYPNLCSMLQTKVMGGEAVQATHDFMCANDETRHFIDEAFLTQDVPGGSELEIVDTVPNCTTVTMTRTPGGERVLGMLKNRLAASCFNPKTKTWHQIKLANVLVVRNLPVPIYISMKNLLREANNSEGELICDLQIGRGIEAAEFPERYRSHAYWRREDNVYYIGSIGNQEDGTYFKRTEIIRDSATGRQDKFRETTSKICSHCGNQQPALRCGRCHKVAYCDSKCQKAHWKSHKPNCHPVKVAPGE